MKPPLKFRLMAVLFVGTACILIAVPPAEGEKSLAAPGGPPAAKPAAADVTALVEKLSKGTKLDNIRAAMKLKLIALDELKAGREPVDLLRGALPGLVEIVEGFANYKDPLGDACHETLQFLGSDAIIAYTRMLQSDKLKYNGLVQMANGLTKALENTPQRSEAVNTALKEVVPLFDNICRGDLSAFQLWGFTSAMTAIGTPAVPALLVGLKDPKPEIRRRYAVMLGSMGAHAREALPALGELKSDPEQDIREAADQAITKIAAASVNKAGNK